VTDAYPAGLPRRAATSTEAALREHIDRLASSQPYAGYERARAEVYAMLDDAQTAERAHGDPSEYWAEELANIEYLFDASPLVIDKLRHHAYHITGVWPYHYRSGRDRSKRQHEVKLEALDALGHEELWVPEAPALGGFGFDLDRGLVNVDTLKFYEALIALACAEALPMSAHLDRRFVVWEIGAGWGGFAHAFKSLFPDTTVVISDLPQTMLLSATYLMALFPEATFVFDNGSGVDESAFEQDFVFVPAHRPGNVTPPHVDLVVNTVSFQEMTTEQVDAYAAQARALRATAVYSLNRERSVYNPELAGVTEILGKYFWLDHVQLLPIAYQHLVDEIPRSRPRIAHGIDPGTPPDDPKASDYRHIVGRRRVATP
jgi:hypothetical protein